MTIDTNKIEASRRHLADIAQPGVSKRCFTQIVNSLKKKDYSVAGVGDLKTIPGCEQSTHRRLRFRGIAVKRSVTPFRQKLRRALSLCFRELNFTGERQNAK